MRMVLQLFSNSYFKLEDKTISTKSLMDLAECDLKYNISEHNDRTYNQKQVTATSTNMAQLYTILFMVDLEESNL